MRPLRGWIQATLAVCLSLAFSHFSARVRADDGLPEPIAWRQLAFTIPFKVADAESPDQQPTEIRLYVSTNLGGKWDLAQSVAPQARNFMFRAPGDGEFWFLIRTVDRGGRMEPDVGGPPELRVIVDTQPPRLELTASRGADGELKASWQAVDPLLNADSLKIEYQTTGGAWRPVAVDRPRAGVDRGATSGTLTWWPTDAPQSAVVVRAEIADRAGNSTTTQSKTESGPALPPPRDDLTAGARNTPTDRVAARPPIAGQPSSPAPQSDSGARQWPADQTTDVPLGRRPIAAPTARDDRASDAGSRRYGFDPPTNTQRNVEDVSPPIRNQFVAQESAAVRQPEPSGTGYGATQPRDALLPPGERPRMVNSRSFEMDYEVDAIGPSGIAKVELWGTRDGGRTWTSYGLDNDNRTPIRANVEGEGLYGFRIAVQSGSGLGGPAPRSGDQPEVWVGIDLTKPNVRLLAADPGAGPRAGELIFNWEAADAALSVRPITLLLADKPGGPWSIIAAGLENNGQYGWRPDNRVPDRIYLRIEARDEAGNVGVFETPQPVQVERIRPEGRIRGVRSVTSDTATGGRVYEFYR